MDLARESALFFEGLYQAGRMRVFAGSAWQRTLAVGPRSITDFQMQVGSPGGAIVVVMHHFASILMSRSLASSASSLAVYMFPSGGVCAH
jgi:hypothetical protein